VRGPTGTPPFTGAVASKGPSYDKVATSPGNACVLVPQAVEMQSSQWKCVTVAAAPDAPPACRDPADPRPHRHPRVSRARDDSAPAQTRYGRRRRGGHESVQSTPRKVRQGGVHEPPPDLTVPQASRAHGQNASPHASRSGRRSRGGPACQQPARQTLHRGVIDLARPHRTGLKLPTVRATRTPASQARRRRHRRNCGGCRQPARRTLHRAAVDPPALASPGSGRQPRPLRTHVPAQHATAAALGSRAHAQCATDAAAVAVMRAGGQRAECSTAAPSTRPPRPRRPRCVISARSARARVQHATTAAVVEMQRASASSAPVERCRPVPPQPFGPSN